MLALVLNASLGWWWTDATAALLVAGYATFEGIAHWRAAAPHEDERDSFPTRRDAQRMRILRWLLLGLLLALFVGGGLFAWRLRERGPSEPSFGNAIDRFHTSTTIAGAHVALQPSAGVYVYSGTGHESLSFMATKQAQGPTEPGTVTPESDGCWTFRMDFNSFHSQTWRRCARGTTLTETGGSADQKFDFVAFEQSEHSTVECDPPITLFDTTARPGTTWPVRCTGHSKTTGTDVVQTGTTTLVGREPVRVDNEPIEAVHVRQDLVLSADQRGTVKIDTWFASSDALPLRETHDLHVISPAPAPLNEVTYREVGEWTLTSRRPST